jgi:RNA ligase partner protein
MKKYVLDTNLFINLQRPLEIGNTKGEVLTNIKQMVDKLTTRGLVEVYMTPAAFEELTGFFKDNNVVVNDWRNSITLTSTNITDLSFSAVLFKTLVEEMGRRLYRGLRVTEGSLNKVLESGCDKSDAKTNKEKYIKELRDRYRRATREGFIDSTIDFELIMLAREKDAVLVTSDQGLIVWGRLFGTKEMLPEVFINQLKELLQTSYSS